MSHERNAELASGCNRHFTRGGHNYNIIIIELILVHPSKASIFVANFFHESLSFHIFQHHTLMLKGCLQLIKTPMTQTIQHKHFIKTLFHMLTILRSEFEIFISNFIFNLKNLLYFFKLKFMNFKLIQIQFLKIQLVYISKKIKTEL